MAQYCQRLPIAIERGVLILKKTKSYALIYQSAATKFLYKCWFQLTDRTQNLIIAADGFLGPL